MFNLSYIKYATAKSQFKVYKRNYLRKNYKNYNF